MDSLVQYNSDSELSEPISPVNMENATPATAAPPAGESQPQADPAADPPLKQRWPGRGDPANKHAIDGVLGADKHAIVGVQGANKQLRDRLIKHLRARQDRVSSCCTISTASVHHFHRIYAQHAPDFMWCPGPGDRATTFDG
ncbi:hypothetical protein GE09DRAFT_1294210 [Coniochaeta sp. 2T2.1]|nr:hypothetical protein GE09DRAFT_1294210 [Coniochaeta sp. 2T2.1]